jgi:transposase-like protein
MSDKRKYVKLTDEQKAELVRLRKEDKLTVTEVATRFGISIGTVNNICKSLSASNPESA